MIMNYEKRIQEMMLNMQKLERDIAYKDEEIKNVKTEYVKFDNCKLLESKY